MPRWPVAPSHACQPAADRTRRPRVVLLAPYWSFWESLATSDLRSDHAALSQRVATAVRAEADVVAIETVKSVDSGRAAADAAATLQADAFVVVQSMAVPPAFTLAALELLSDLPVVVFAVSRERRHGSDFDRAAITMDGATVGTPQLTNVLHRSGRPHALVVGLLDDPLCAHELGAAVRAASVAGRLRRARIARIGTPIEGYDCVDCDEQALKAALGIELVPVHPDRVRRAYVAADADRVAKLEREVRDTWELAPDLEADECLARSVRFAAALEEFDHELGVDAGAMNCHVEEIRFAEEPGITPCFALGRETSRGIPWTCAGDVVTAVAMLTVKLLGAPALYHEIEALDYHAGEALLANTGEHDLGWWPGTAPPMLVRNGWFDATDPRCGACACFSLPAGPCTLVAFTPHADEPSGFRYIVAAGELSGRSFPASGTPNGAFRFAGSPNIAAAWARWTSAGANHHSAAAPGAIAEQIEAVARHLGVGCVQAS